MLDPEYNLLKHSKEYIIQNIMKMNLDEILYNIVQFYTCPPSCKSTCCAKFNIYYSLSDRERISEKHKKHMQKLKIHRTREEPISGITIPVDFVYPEQPCPFLHKGKCSIYYWRPSTCAFYPMGLDELRQLTLQKCYMGLDILIDFYIYKKIVKTAKPEHDYQFDDTILEEFKQDKNRVENIGKVVFYDARELAGFLLFLCTNDLTQYREEVKRLGKED